MSKKERETCEFEMDLNNFFVCALIQVMMTCKTTLRPGLKTGMDFRGLVSKRVWKMTFFGLKGVQD